MSAYDVTLTDGRRCGACGHDELASCPCSCCPNSYEFAATCSALAEAALRDADPEMADFMFTAADYWSEPDEATLTARLMLLSAAIGRNEGPR